MKETVQDLKIEIKTIKKTQTEGRLQIENLTKRTGTTDARISNRMQEMEPRISDAEDTIEKIDSSVKENTKAKEVPKGMKILFDGQTPEVVYASNSKNVYDKNFKSLKKLKKVSEDGKISHAHGPVRIFYFVYDYETCQPLATPIYFREDMGIEEPADGVNFHCGKRFPKDVFTPRKQEEQPVTLGRRGPKSNQSPLEEEEAGAASHPQRKRSKEQPVTLRGRGSRNTQTLLEQRPPLPRIQGRNGKTSIQKYENLIFDKDAKTIKCNKESIFNKWCWHNWMSTCRRLQIDPYLSPCTKLKSKWIKDLNINPVTLNLIEEKVGSTLECIGTGDHFLNITPTAQTLSATINQWDYMKLRSFCKAKDTITKTKHQPTEWEKIFTNPTSDRGLISRIYKELKKHDIKTPDSPIEKWAIELNREFMAEEY
ncbi:hypothetical protein STEG23_012666 [Scotinomys teguina]